MLGIGIDIVDVARVARAIERWDNHFLMRVLTSEEVRVCRERGHFEQSVAARFAAKEAFFKAIPGSGARRLTWKDIAVVNSRGGRPLVRLSERARRLIGAHRVAVSLSHTTECATAVVLID